MITSKMIVEKILSGMPVREALGMFGEDDSFFTKEELLEFASDVVDEVNSYYKSVNSSFSVDYTGAWVESDDRTITVDFICFPNETEYSVSVKVDMRSIKAPGDIFKFIPKMAEDLKKQIQDAEVSETKKANGKILREDDQEYWDYVAMYDYGVPGHEEEVEKAADYFDVSPSAFSELYADFYRE